MLNHQMKKFTNSLIAFLSLILLLKLITLAIYPFHHPSEVRYAAIAMRMVLTGNFLMPYFDPITPFFGKPPLSFWASAISFKIFGFSEFAGRLPHLLALVLICFVMYRAVKKIYDEKTALISVLILASSLLFYALHSVMTEAFLLLGMTLISCSFILAEWPLFFLGCIVAMLTKGPVGIVMPCLAIPVYLTLTKSWKNFFRDFPFVRGALIFLAATLPWFYLAEKNYPGFLEYFLLGENFGRFAKSDWEGDRYGNAHRVMFGAIWYFFAASVMPALLALFLRPRQIFFSFVAEARQDKNFLFFALSLAIPLILLTFMCNMIMTYAIYSLVPFAIVLARILVKIKWEKFSYFLGYTTITLYTFAILAFLAKPKILLEHLNQQAYLISQIPEKNFELFALGEARTSFTLYWQTRDKLKIVNAQNFEQVNPHSYLVDTSASYLKLTSKQKSQLKEITCTIKHRACLYEKIT
ncbi:MAG: glycosyltransferase family 39 protein [Alphaproteobacteria bacterium]|nr:glycosyltransferase family 39 protein [Alphaproteobacteria bacterium]